MSVSILISDVIFGGTGSDNPRPLTMDNYHLTHEEQQLSYTGMNVIAPYLTGTKSVTALVQLDPITGDPMVGPNDICHPPCPPIC